MAPSSPQPSDEFARLRSVEPTSHDRETDEFHQEKVRREAAIADEYEQRNKNRYGYANIFIRIAIGWLAFVGIIVLANSVDGCPFSISDEVIMVLLGTATVNVLAPAVLLAKYLFRNQS